MATVQEHRARLYVGLGVAAGMLATVGVGLARQAGRLEDLSPRYLAGTVVPPLLAVIGLGLGDRRPRLGGALVVMAAGLLLGTAAVGSADGTGLLWMPGAVLLTLGAYGLVRSARRRPPLEDSRPGRRKKSTD